MQRSTRYSKPSILCRLAAERLQRIKPQGDAPDIIWAPIPNSPQEKAYYSPADELFYGGAAGSGKGGSCHGIQWAIDNIPWFTVDSYHAIRHLVPVAIQQRDTTVLGADGRFIPFSMLNEGDRIMNPDGHPQFVQHIFERGTLPIYRVEFEDGAAVECDRDHLWLVAENGDWDYPIVQDVEWLKSAMGCGGIFFVPTCKPLQFDAPPAAIDDPLEAAVSHARTQGLLAQIGNGTVKIWGSDRGKRITAITPAGQVYTRCIAVSNPNQLYITDGYTVTHNTDLLLGLAGTAHKRSLILRREFPRIRGMIERSRDIYNRFGAERDKDSYNESLHLWRLQDDRTIEFGAVQYERDWLKFQGRDHCLKAFDEITEFTEKQYRSINIWNRSSEPNQRVRSVCTGNPPTSIDGEWVIDYWAPWLDSDYPNPARPEDLVWFVRVKKDYVDVLRELYPDLDLIPGKPDPVNDEVDLAIARTTREQIAEYQATGEPIPRPTIQIGDKVVTGKSRTFIPGKVEDNPYLMAAGYDKQLDALPEELRIRFRQGIFVRVMEDSTNQIVPTAWVVAAQERWIALMGTNKLLPTKDAIALYKQLISNVTQTVIGCDPARGGIDKTCLAARYGNWYAPVLSIPGKDTPTGQDVARHIASLHEYPGRIAIDVIGIGSSPYDACKERRLPTVGLNGAEKAITPMGKPATDRSGLLTFANKRAEWIWKFAEMLDPQHGSEIMLPPDPEIKTDLCSIRRVNTESRVIQVEKKSEIKERIGRSPDKGEAIIYASVVTRAVYADITTSDPNPIRSVLSEL